MAKFRLARTVTKSEWYEVECPNMKTLKTLVAEINAGDIELDDVAEFVGEGSADEEDVRIV